MLLMIILCFQVSEDPPDLKGSWDLRETQETPDLQDPLDYKVIRNILFYPRLIQTSNREARTARTDG